MARASRMDGRSPKSEKLDKCKNSSGPGVPGRHANAIAAGPLRSGDDPRDQGCQDGQWIKIGPSSRHSAGTLTQPDHVARYEPERCLLYMWPHPVAVKCRHRRVSGTAKFARNRRASKEVEQIFSAKIR